MLLRLYLDQLRVDTKSEQLKVLLKTVIKESQILRSNTSITCLDGLVHSLQEFNDWKASGRVFEFLDHCVLRFVRKPVHYYDILADLIAAAGLDINPTYCQVDLLLITIMDQWRFLVENADAPTVTNVSKWLVRFIEVMSLGDCYVENIPLRDENTKLLLKIRDRLKSDVQDATCRALLGSILEGRPNLGTLKTLIATNTTTEARHMSRLADAPLKRQSKLPATFSPPGPPDEHEDHPGLHQWTRHEIHDAIGEGHIKALILCLCSKYVGIRKQAIAGVRAFMMKLEVGRITYPLQTSLMWFQVSGYSEWQQTYLLVGEIIETVAKVIADDPLPYYAGVLAASLFPVLSDPLHLMYGKVNEFLNRGPEWNVKKLPSYWVDKVLKSPPTDDDGHHHEAEWLLDGLIDGLRTSAVSLIICISQGES